MTSDYQGFLTPQPFEEWLEQVVGELYELGHTQDLSQEQRDWLYDIWDTYDFSPAEATQSFINETSA